IDEDDIEEMDIKWNMALLSMRADKEVKYIEKIRTLEYYNESYKESNESLKKKLETLQQEKEGVDGKLAGLLTASKDLDNLIESQRPSPTVESTSEDNQNRNSFASKDVASPITPKPFVKPVGHRPHGPPVRPMRSNMNAARPNRTFFNIQAHSYETRPFLRTTTVKSQFRAPWVPTVNRNNPPVNRKFSTGSRNFPTANRKFPTARRKFPTGEAEIHTADMGRKGKAVKPSACWIWKPSQNLTNKVPKTKLMIKAIGIVAALGT
nr:hypothetical protein [Tanacetum cinerariifolium]